MRAILVSVDYADLLALTLPYNRHHFSEVWVVTAPRDGETLRVAEINGCRTFATNSFWDDGAAFNKWKALEQGLDAMGREGWLCLMDADVLWPKELEVIDGVGPCAGGSLFISRKEGACGLMLHPGTLAVPRRRMDLEWHRENGLPPEDRWQGYPVHPQHIEFAGYSQIFHASDPALGPPPWHQTNWLHAGGADSFFQAKWQPENKIRPPFEVLHLGAAGQNWFGRATPLADGTVLPGSAERLEASSRRIWNQRKLNVAAGRDKYDGERIVKK